MRRNFLHRVIGRRGGAERALLSLLTIVLMSVSAWSADLAMQQRGAEAMRKFKVSKGISAPATAILITDLSDGSTVVELNADTPLLPASIMKTVSIATLLQEVGPDWQYVTEVNYDGRIKDEVLEGNLVVTGSGDPTVNSVCEPLTPDIVAEIATELRQNGVRHIVGKLLVDESVFPGPACPPSWAPGDLSASYGTGCHGFNYRNNATGKKSVANPVSKFLSDLAKALRDEGITIEGLEMPRGKHHKLIEHRSAPVSDIMRSCMMRSDNLFAEAILRTYAVRKGKSGSTSEAASLETEYWKKKRLPMDGVHIVDGSGLSRSNRVTARFMEGVLRQMKDDVDYASFLPLAGQEGTLKNFLSDTPLDSYIAMKTGSMNGVQCYAGYKLDDDFAPTHAVVVIMNALPAGRGVARAAVADMLLEIFNVEKGIMEQI